MHFVVLEATPHPKATHLTQYGGATVSFWINAVSDEEALSRARAILRAQAWSEVRVIELRPIQRTDYLPGDHHLEYFDQAVVDDEVCVFYTYPADQEADPSGD